MSNISSKIYFKNIAVILIIAMFFIIDRFLKMLALNMEADKTKNIIGQIFSFSFTKNYNIAFSLPLGGPVLNIIIISLILVIILIIGHSIWQEKKISKKSIVLTFILFGAISNIVDRLKYGFVIDYLELKYFTIFNLADIMISLGAIILILQNLKSTSLCSKEISKTH